MSRTTFRIWYAVWVSDTSMVFIMRRTKKAAKAALREGKKFAPELTFGIMRLTEQVKAKRRRSRRKSTKPRVTRRGHLNATLLR